MRSIGSKVLLKHPRPDCTNERHCNRENLNCQLKDVMSNESRAIHFLVAHNSLFDKQRHFLEPGHIHQPLIRNLQFGNHGQRQKRHRHERIVQGGA
jgi:hypothetical protein